VVPGSANRIKEDQAMKTYGNEAVAKQIADKLSEKGTVHVVVPHEGQFAVCTEAEAASLTTKKAAKTGSKKPAAAAAPAAKKPAKVAVTAGSDEQVTLKIDGAHATKQYVITPEMGGRPRWFERKRLTAVTEYEGGVEITAPKREFLSRKLGDMIAA
jgi:hypothetical protein